MTAAQRSWNQDPAQQFGSPREDPSCVDPAQALDPEWLSWAELS